jgi:type I restriction enzyme, S subunit
MSNTNENKLVPKFRFPEFVNDGEWRVKEFSNFIKLYRGSSPRPIQDYLTQNQTGVNWIKIGDTKFAVNSILAKVEEKITPKGAEKSRKVEIGELILANSMSFGKTYQLAIAGCIYDGWFVLREYENHFYKPFLLQLLNSEYMQNQYQRLSAGGIVQNISSDIVYNSKVFHTSLPEQQKIAACLSSLDEVITFESQKLQVLKEHKKGLLQNLFPQAGETVPKLRFKEFADSGNWVEKTIEKIAKVTTGNKDTQNKINDGTYPFFVRSQNVERINSYSYDGEAILTSGDGVGVGKNFHYINGKFDFHQRVYCIYDFDKEVIGQFVFMYFSQHFNERVMKMTAKNSVDSVRMAMITEMPILIPSKQEQKKIAVCLSSIDKIINAQSQKVETLKLHKKGLLQGLFPKIND